MEKAAKQRELAELERRVAQLQRELAEEGLTAATESAGFYAAYYATTGFLLGAIGAGASLLANVLGSLAWPSLAGQPDQHPLRLIQVYLTFPLGARALEIDGGLTLAIGCCLYIGTGMVYGMLFQLAQARLVPGGRLGARLVLITVLALGVWLVNFYGILSWLQPLLFGDNWIVRLVPAWVAAATHLVFGWTMALVYPLGEYVPYRTHWEE